MLVFSRRWIKQKSPLLFGDFCIIGALERT